MRKTSVEVEGGKTIINEVRHALEGILKSAQHNYAKAMEIANFTESQLANADEVKKMINEVASASDAIVSSVEETSSSVEEMTASAEEISATSQELAKLSSNLRELIGRFTL